MSRSRSTYWVLVCLVVFAISVGVLTMHGLDTVGPAGTMHDVMNASVRSVDRAPAQAPGMGYHDLAPCLWLLVGGIAVLLATSSTMRPRAASLVAALRESSTNGRAEPRGPPSAVRLSLVGVLRR